jgi:hypothetical protein
VRTAEARAAAIPSSSWKGLSGKTTIGRVRARRLNGWFYEIAHEPYRRFAPTSTWPNLLRPKASPGFRASPSGLAAQFPSATAIDRRDGGCQNPEGRVVQGGVMGGLRRTIGGVARWRGVLAIVLGLMTALPVGADAAWFGRAPGWRGARPVRPDGVASSGILLRDRGWYTDARSAAGTTDGRQSSGAAHVSRPGRRFGMASRRDDT